MCSVRNRLEQVDDSGDITIGEFQDWWDARMDDDDADVQIDPQAIALRKMQEEKATTLAVDRIKHLDSRSLRKSIQTQTRAGFHHSQLHSPLQQQRASSSFRLAEHRVGGATATSAGVEAVAEY